MSAPPTFVSNRLAELPVAMNGPQGRAWATGTGTVQDQQLAMLRVAALSRLPFYCPDDALDAVGTLVLLPRFPGEVNGSAPTRPGLTNGTGYRGRLCAAWQTWKLAGSKQAIITSLQAWGAPDVSVENDYEVQAGPDPWPGAWWSRFRVLLGPNLGAFGWGVGNDPTADQQSQIARQILLFKWLYAYPVDVVIDDGAGYTFTFWLGPLWGGEENPDDYGFIWDYSIWEGYNPL